SAKALSGGAPVVRGSRATGLPAVAGAGGRLGDGDGDTRAAQPVDVFVRGVPVDDDVVELGERGEGVQRAPLELGVIHDEQAGGGGVEHRPLGVHGLLRLVEADVVGDRRGGDDGDVGAQVAQGGDGHVAEE